ncbi:MULTISPECIES: metal ABC transporter solute-binding protein, Zn/Mn family [unclassified Halomonas]|uniref:metal ABC transporter solute-binding protein, Zn/Mn family n=1 Tax=unclassified Halomonas TaxID=2609666 RepID=UPI0028873611|nr:MULTISPECIES: zinc ABC transporter substrate-binding protein [unclassified Halomonas]MDT0499493.1 zinc ABC transporter substrate-binding protein [Halomonas sp. PAR7]MDT0510690.1 zinc ABC transporter substrate-binding protein [Halomonas sp. LES1]MDT0592297.1 zinc ABC transporter substrate-binding protein [Halomonas sp. PAR8]
MPKLSRRLASLLGLTLMLAVAPALADSRLNVVATTGMIADVVREIGGDRVEVKGLMGPGVDPHLYRQTRSDVVAMSRADAVFWNGLNLEVQLTDLLDRLAQRSPVYAVGEAVPRERLLADEDYADQPDPHIWMDPGRWRHAVVAVRDALIELDPEATEEFEARTEAYLENLEALDAYAREVLDTIPASSRVLVTAHDAFGYFGEAYALEVMGIQGFSTESEAGLSRIENLVDLLVEREIGAVFVETSVSERSVRALSEGSAAVGHEVRIGGELFSDAMGPEGTYEGSWLGMFDHNVTTIARALGGSAPEQGWRGRLGMDASHTDEEE